MNRRQKIIVSITGIFIVLLALVGLTYAYFLTRITENENDKSISVTTANLELVYGDGTTDILTSNTPLEPNSDIPIGTKDFTVTNNGDNTNYLVTIENVKVLNMDTGEKTTFETNDFVYTLTCTKKDGTSCNETKIQTIFPLKDEVLIWNIIEENDEHSYVLTLWYLETNKDQSNDMNKTLEAKINIVNTNEYLSELSEVNPTVLSNISSWYEPSSYRTATYPFFQIPINSNSTIEVINNSEDYCIVAFSYAIYLDVTLDSGWIAPKTSKKISVNNFGNKYLGILLKSFDGSAVDLNSINLSDFIVQYEGNNNNLLSELTYLEYNYKNASLVNYDFNQLTSYVNDIPLYAHGGGKIAETPEETAARGTMATLRRAVEESGFTLIELDVRVTADENFVLYHDATIEGMEKSIRSSKLTELKEFKNDLLTLDEALEYLSQNNIKVILDVKAFPDSQTAVDKFFNVIEKYNMQNKFNFSMCHTNLLKNIPEEYSHISYSVYENWDDTYAGNDRIYYSSSIKHLNISKYIELLRNGHKKFEIYDTGAEDFTGSGKERILNKLAVCVYLAQQYGVDVHFTFYKNIDFDFSLISEKQMIKYLQKDLWDASGLIRY